VGVGRGNIWRARRIMHVLLPIVLGLLAPPDQNYEQATAELQTAIDGSTSDDRKAAIAALEDAIALQGQYPDHASASVPESVLEARVILVRLHLANNDAEAAQAAMDDLIRTARGQSPPVRSYGPEVTKLYTDRKAVLQQVGVGTLEVACSVECEVVVNERRSTTSEKLFLGRYRVWVKAVGPDASWEYHEVDLIEAGAVTTITYEGPVAAPVVEDTSPPPEPAPVVKKRMLPRGAEIAGMAVGAGLVIAGAVLLSFDGKCSSSKRAPSEATTLEECGSIYDTVPTGASLVGIGGGLLVISGVVLGIDEVRVGRATGRQVMLGVTLRF
jgi:hypothetical protein